MPQFSERSLIKLKQCDGRLQTLFSKVVEKYDCTILEGHRDEPTQNEYFETGKSKLQWPDSKHNKYPSKGIDAAPYPIEWDNWSRWYHFAGYVLAVADELGIKVRSGLDWDGDKQFKDQSFNDAPHWELVE